MSGRREEEALYRRDERKGKCYVGKGWQRRAGGRRMRGMHGESG